jgi:hypothetical protein
MLEHGQKHNNNKACCGNGGNACHEQLRTLR